MNLSLQHLKDHKFALCSLCRSIPFFSLPSEHQAGHPHQPSLDALFKSSETCGLCHLLLFSLSCSLAGQGGMTKYLPSGNLPEDVRANSNIWAESNRNKWGMRANSSGMTFLEPNGPVIVNFSGPPQADLKRLPAETKKIMEGMQVCVFGNWWKLPNAPDKDQYAMLNGLGVRLGKGLGIKDGFGNSEEQIQFPGTFLRVKIDDHSRDEAKVSGRLITQSPGSDLALRRLDEFLKMCDGGHKCAALGDVELPGRIIEILGDDGKARTRETKEETGRYLALMHHWSPTSNLAPDWKKLELNHEFKVEDIKSIECAAKIAKRYNVKYIWTPALLSLELGTSKTDEATTSALNDRLMSLEGAFRNAYFTVSETSISLSNNPAKNIFTERSTDSNVSTDSVASARLVIPYASPLIHEVTDPDNKTGSSSQAPRFSYMAWNLYSQFRLDEPSSNPRYPPPMLYITPEWMPSSVRGIEGYPRDNLIGSNSYAPPFDSLMEEPLFKTPWGFIQRCLAPRIIHYATQQMYWECTYLWAEDGALMYRTFYPLTWIINQVPDYSEPRLVWPDPWFKLVERYSWCESSNPEDKLLGLSVVAKKWAEKSKDEYLAGTWKSNLVAGLFWEVEKPRPEYPNVGKRAENGSPSWSWSSVNAVVSFGGMKREDILVEVLDASVVPGKWGKYGPVESGKIRLKAHLFEITVEPQAEDDAQAKQYPESSFQSRFTTTGRDDRKVAGSANIDHPSCLPTHVIAVTSSWALLLCSTPISEGKNMYVRVGTGSFDRTNEISKLEGDASDGRQELTLI